MEVSELGSILSGLAEQRAVRFFSERRLRPLLIIPEPAKQVREFNRMMEAIPSAL